jgi:high affinity Mn2+ porin
MGLTAGEPAAGIKCNFNFTWTLVRPLCLAVLVLAPASGGAQEDENKAGSQESESKSTSIFHRSPESRFWISGQANVIFQAQPPFAAEYAGANSFQSRYEKATSRIMTLYTGVRVNLSTEVLFDVESAGGQGLSGALGLAGFTNVDVVRNPTLGERALHRAH